MRPYDVSYRIGIQVPMPKLPKASSRSGFSGKLRFPYSLHGADGATYLSVTTKSQMGPRELRYFTI